MITKELIEEREALLTSDLVKSFDLSDWHGQSQALWAMYELGRSDQRQRERQAVADMFWDDDNPEDSFQASEGDMAAYFAEYVPFGTEKVFEAQMAIRLANRKMRVKVSEDGNDYEWDWVDDAPSPELISPHPIVEELTKE